MIRNACRVFKAEFGGSCRCRRMRRNVELTNNPYSSLLLGPCDKVARCKIALRLRLSFNQVQLRSRPSSGGAKPTGQPEAGMQSINTRLQHRIILIIIPRLDGYLRCQGIGWRRQVVRGTLCMLCCAPYRTISNGLYIAPDYAMSDSTPKGSMTLDSGDETINPSPFINELLSVYPVPSSALSVLCLTV